MGKFIKIIFIMIIIVIICLIGYSIFGTKTNFQLSKIQEETINKNSIKYTGLLKTQSN